MLTKEQRAEINRRNAQKSTGPQSEEGKLRTRMNAYRHGQTGQVIVMPAEDLEAYGRFQKSFYQAYEPEGPVETQLVQSMVDASWKMNQSSAWQHQILSEKACGRFNSYPEENNPQLNEAWAVASVVAQMTKELANFSIYEQRAHRIFERSLDRLTLVQEKRQEQRRVDLTKAAALLKLHEQEELEKQQAREEEARQAVEAQQPSPAPYLYTPYCPAGDGFVFSIAEIKEHSRREERFHEGWAVSRVEEEEDDEAAA